jgi:hypothetical protein
MNKIFFYIILASLMFACKDQGIKNQQKSTVEKDPQAIADSTIRATKRSFEASSPAASYDSFTKAVSIGDGSTVAQMAGEGTLSYYADIYQKVMTAPKSEIEAMPLGEQQMILMSRLLLPERGLKSMDTRTYLQSLVETGALDKVSLGIIKPADIQTQGTTASAPAIILGSPANLPIEFSQGNDGEWRVNMGQVIKKAAAFYDEKFQAMGNDVSKQVRNSVSAFAPDSKFDESLFNPLQ